MKELFTYIRDIFKGSPPLKVVIGTILLFTALTAICIIFRQILIHAGIIIVLIVWLIYEDYKKRRTQETFQQQMQINQEYVVVYKCVEYALSNISKRINIQQPVNVNSIIPPDPFIYSGEVHTFKCRALKNDSKPIDKDELEVFKVILQNEVNTVCATNAIGTIPSIDIIDIHDSKAYLLIEVAIVTNQAIYEYILRRRQIEKQIEQRNCQRPITTSPTTAKKIPLAYNKDLLDEGMNKNDSIIKIPIDRFVHTLVIGSTGTGKTTFLKILISSVLKFIENVEIWVLDFKNDDFKFLDGYDKYFKFDECLIGLDEFYNVLKDRQSGIDQSKTTKILLIDEFAALISSISDKKIADAAKSKLNELLMLGRSFQLKIICGAQRGDSSNFGTGGSRDNFQIIVALGSISKESRDMFFSDFKEKILPDRTIGTGYLLIGNSKLVSIQIPNVSNMAKLEAAIKRAVETQNSPTTAVED